MKKDTKLILIVLAGILAIVLLCIFAVQGTQNKAFTLEEQVNTAQSDIRVQEKRRVDLVYNLADCVMQYDKHEAVNRLEKGVGTTVFWIFWIIGTGVIVFKFYERENEWLE